jgi:hypothetical protein
MQDRSFYIAGPYPTPEEQKYIDEQYTAYLEKQRNNNIAAAFAKQQQQEQLKLEQASLRSETTTEKIPIPQARPKVLQQAGEQRARNCPRHNFSCEWPRLSESLNELKKLFNSNASSKGKKS